MLHNRKTASILAAILAMITVFLSWIVFTFLPDSPQQVTFSLACFVVGILSSFLLFFVITKLPNQRWVRVTTSVLFALCASIPFSSAVVPRITYSRFGFTIYGATPVPYLDITINRNGMLWFRPKTHKITRDELETLIAPGVDVIVVGIGWDSIAQLTDDAKQLGVSIELRVLPTPQAFALYNKLKADGRNVVLLAHSTC